MSETDARVRNRLLLLGLLLLLIIPLALALRDAVREVIVIPLLYVVWFGGLLFNAVHQVFLWTIFLVIVLFLAVTSLVRREKPMRRVQPVHPGNPGRVRVWAQRIYLMERGGYSRWYVAQHLRRVILEIMAYHERLDIERIKPYLATGELETPLEIQVCLQVGLDPALSRARGIFARFWNRLRPGARVSPPDLDLESVVQFLEDQLEVKGLGSNQSLTGDSI